MANEEIMQLEQDVMDKAAELGALEEEAAIETAPFMEMTKAEANKLITSVNKVLALFDAEPIEMVAEDVAGPMPVELFNALTTIKQAIMDAGLDEYGFEFSELEDPRAVQLLVGKIDKLAGDSNFKTFLKSAPTQMEPTPAAPEAAPMEAAPEMAGEPTDEEIEELMTARM